MGQEPFASPSEVPWIDVDVTIDVTPESTSAWRRVVVNAVRPLVRESVLTDLLIVGGELVANAVEHGRFPVSLRVLGAPAWLLIRVSDGGRTSGFGALPADPSAERGRGLAIVEGLATEWGVDAVPRGKTVWARLRADDADGTTKEGATDGSGTIDE